MKAGWLTLMGAALLALAGFCIRAAFWNLVGASRASLELQDREAREALAWMKSEFRLTDAEFTKICALHDAYVPECDKMCDRIAVAGSKVSTVLLQTDANLSTDAESALRNYEAVRSECQRATLRHLHETAAAMNPESRRAFLAKVLPHLYATQQHVSDVTR